MSLELYTLYLFTSGLILLAQIDDRWSKEHRQTVKQLEEQMDREICGAPTSSGLPCKEWPIDDHGRCSKHDPAQTRQSSSATSPESPDRTTEPDNSKPSYSLRYWLILGFVGLFLGGAVTAALLQSDYTKWGGAEPSSTTVSSSEPTVEMNVDNPDWSRLFQMENAGTIIMNLKKIASKTNSPATRSRALYYQFVFYGNNEQPAEALSVANEFINSFPDHALRAEVLYGAGMICKQQADSCEINYHERLREEYPDSSWTEELTS